MPDSERVTELRKWLTDAESTHSEQFMMIDYVDLRNLLNHIDEQDIELTRLAKIVERYKSIEQAAREAYTAHDLMLDLESTTPIYILQDRYNAAMKALRRALEDYK